MNHNETLLQVVEMVVIKLFSDEVRDLVSELPEHTEEAAAKFCDRFELGSWFYEALILNEVDICDWLSEIAGEKEVAEKEAADERAEIERDYRAMQGWPV